MKPKIPVLFKGVLLTHLIVTILFGVVFSISHPFATLLQNRPDYIRMGMVGLLGIVLYFLAGYILIVGIHAVPRDNRDLVAACVWLFVILLCVYLVSLLLVDLTRSRSFWFVYVLMNYPLASIFNSLSLKETLSLFYVFTSVIPSLGIWLGGTQRIRYLRHLEESGNE